MDYDRDGKEEFGMIEEGKVSLHSRMIKKNCCVCVSTIKKGACELSTFLGVMKNPKSLFTH